jgi:hypothetical protein
MRENRRPGERLIDRFMPNASSAEHEQAYENLLAFAEVLLASAMAEVREEQAADSRNKGGGGIMETHPPAP